jgi:hypothetical protein
MKTTRAAPFFAAVWTGTAPLLVWGLHFAASYVAVAVACAGATPNPAALRAWLAAATALAALALAMMLWRSLSSARRSGHARYVRCVCAALSLVGVAWAGVPIALLPVCTL